MKARKVTVCDVIDYRLKQDENSSTTILYVNLGWSQEIHNKVCHLHELISIRGINRGLYLHDFDAIRKSDYYQNLKAKLKQDVNLNGFAYFYFTMVTDDINNLELTTLEKQEEQFKYEEFLPNFNILLAVRRWQEEKNPENKTKLNLKLREALNARGNLPIQCKHYLNLRGVNLAGADLSMTNLEYIDLTGALLNNCNLNETVINGSCLDGADLSHSTFIGLVLPFRTTTLTDSTAKNACFDHAKVEGACWDKSQFTGSSFKNAIVSGVTFNPSDLDHCDFTNAILRMDENDQCTLRHVNLVGCSFVCKDLNSVKMWDEIIFPPHAFTCVTRFSNVLDNINERIMLQINSSNKNQHEKSSLRKSYQWRIAGNMIERVNNSMLANDDKIACINAALDHDIFMPESYYSQLAYRAERSVYAFFAMGSREYFAIDSTRILEDARDRLLSNRNRNW
jgi:uncharacterized protein YjbI with pentapeptide repeats